LNKNLDRKEKIIVADMTMMARTSKRQLQFKAELDYLRRYVCFLACVKMKCGIKVLNLIA